MVVVEYYKDSICEIYGYQAIIIWLLTQAVYHLKNATAFFTSKSRKGGIVAKNNDAVICYLSVFHYTTLSFALDG